MAHLIKSSRDQWWKYLLTFLVAFIGANIIGAIPLILVIFKSDNGHFNLNSDNPMDLVQYGVDPNLGLILLVFPFIIGLISGIWMIKRLHKRSICEVINGTSLIRWKRIVYSFLFWIFLMSIYLAIDLLINQSNYQIQFNPSSFFTLIAVSLIFIPIQTSFEEVMFRGYLTQGVSSWTRNRWLAIILPGILFGLLHSNNPEIEMYGFWLTMPHYISFGILFGLTTILDDGIEVALGVHAANNIFASIFVTFESSAIQTPALLKQLEINPLKELIVFLACSSALIIILSRKYKWDFAILNQKIVADPN